MQPIISTKYKTDNC